MALNISKNITLFGHTHVCIKPKFNNEVYNKDVQLSIPISSDPDQTIDGMILSVGKELQLLNREEVYGLVRCLATWLATGDFFIREGK